MEEIRILQLGDEDWNIVYTLPQWVRLDYAEHLDESPGKKEAGRPYDLCFLDRTPREEEMVSLYEMAKEDGIKSIDSAQLCSLYHKELYMVKSTSNNMKITEPADFYICRALYDAQEGQQVFGI